MKACLLTTILSLMVLMPLGGCATAPATAPATEAASSVQSPYPAFFLKPKANCQSGVGKSDDTAAAIAMGDADARIKLAKAIESLVVANIEQTMRNFTGAGIDGSKVQSMAVSASRVSVNLDLQGAPQGQAAPVPSMGEWVVEVCMDPDLLIKQANDAARKVARELDIAEEDHDRVMEKMDANTRQALQHPK